MNGLLDYLKGITEIVQEQAKYATLEGQFEKYNDLKDKLNLTKKYLNDSLVELNSVSKNVINGYSVDGESGDSGFLEKTRKNIEGTYNYLKDVVIPDVEKKLKNLSDIIEDVSLE